MILSELLLNLRKELSKAENEKAVAGFDAKYRVSKINLELYMDDVKEIGGGLEIKIINVGAGKKTKNYHKINIELVPLKHQKIHDVSRINNQ